jgi:hypothetical protein
MTKETITRNQRTSEIVQGEIEALGRLIDKRNLWLKLEVNKQRSTYDAVSKDTANMRSRLAELQAELTEIEL